MRDQAAIYLANILAGIDDSAADAWLREGFRRHLALSRNDGRGPTLMQCLGVGTNGQALRTIRDHWLRKAAAELTTSPEASTWSRARALHHEAARFHVRWASMKDLAFPPDGLPAARVFLWHAAKSGAPLPTTIQAFAEVIGQRSCRHMAA